MANLRIIRVGAARLRLGQVFLDQPERPASRYTSRMIASAATAAPIEVAAIQAALVADGIDAWLLYDFHGLNPIAVDITAVARQGGHLATRRWFYLIPATGTPRKLVHAIERSSLAHLPGSTEKYAGREQLEDGLRHLLAGQKRVAMEYSPNCAIPYVARVDAGTIELVKSVGVEEVVSSGDLIQRFAAVWNDRDMETHRVASEKLHRIKDRAFDEIRRRIAGRISTTEYDIQQNMVAWFAEEGLVSDSPPNVSVSENAGTRTISPPRASISRSDRASSCCWTFGANSSSLARCLLILRGWDSPGRHPLIATSKRSKPSPPPGMPRSVWSSGRFRPDTNCGVGRSIAPPRRC